MNVFFQRQWIRFDYNPLGAHKALQIHSSIHFFPLGTLSMASFVIYKHAHFFLSQGLCICNSQCLEDSTVNGRKCASSPLVVAGGEVLALSQEKGFSENHTEEGVIFICVELNPCIFKVPFPLVQP